MDQQLQLQRSTLARWRFAAVLGPWTRAVAWRLHAWRKRHVQWLCYEIWTAWVDEVWEPEDDGVGVVAMGRIVVHVGRYTHCDTPDAITP